MRYTSSSRQNSFRKDVPLTNEEILQHAPSIMSVDAHDSRSSRYAVIPTINVLDSLREEGFEPFEVRQTKVRDQSKKDFTKHLIRLRHASQITEKSEAPEIVMLNSHDGSSSYRLMAGFFRMVCSNGLISGEFSDDIRVRHSGDVINNVIEGSYKVLDNIEVATESLKEFKQIILKPEEKYALANASIDLKWERDEVTKEAPVSPSRLLLPRRAADTKDDLWTTMNVIQENIIRGGLTSTKRDKNNRIRRNTTRPVKSVTEDVRLNKAIWTLSKSLADHLTS